MLNTERMKRVFANLNTKQMMISDPYAIFYLTGKWIFPGERFLGLLIREGKTPVLFVNELFRFDEEIGVEKVYLKDTDDLPAIFAKYVDQNESLGVDKILPARFLLPSQQEKAVLLHQSRYSLLFYIALLIIS